MTCSHLRPPNSTGPPVTVASIPGNATPTRSVYTDGDTRTLSAAVAATISELKTVSASVWPATGSATGSMESSAESEPTASMVSPSTAPCVALPLTGSTDNSTLAPSTVGSAEAAGSTGSTVSATGSAFAAEVFSPRTAGVCALTESTLCAETKVHITMNSKNAQKPARTARYDKRAYNINEVVRILSGKTSQRSILTSVYRIRAKNQMITEHRCRCMRH